MHDEEISYRDRFHIPTRSDGTEAVYLSGHSLGLQPKTVRSYIEQELKDWELLGVEGHFHARNPWITYHRTLRDQTARVVGAEPGEVAVMNSLTVNLHLMMASFYRPTPSRFKVVMEAGAFPSDRYAVESQIRFHGFDPELGVVELSPRPGEALLRTEDIVHSIGELGDSAALVLLSGVNYSTGQLFDMDAITRAGHENNCAVGFDLAHAAGNLPLRLHDWDVDFAVWCSYKYLNGGPGCVAGSFVHARHAEAWELPRLAGWWGHEESSRFQMGPEFRPMRGAEGWQLSNPPILALAALRASMDLFDEVGMQRLRERSLQLTGYLERSLRENKSGSYEVITPSNVEERGAQLSIRMRRGGRKVCDALGEQGIVCDWREPDILRAAPVPLYNSFGDLDRFSAAFHQIVS